MSVLDARGVAGARLPRVDLLCDPGLHALVVPEPEAAAELVEILAGLARPRRGRVRLGGDDPYRSAALRQRTGTLLWEEPLLDGATVEVAVGRALALHGSPLKAADVLEPFALGLLASRPPGALPGAERRAVALALALTVRPVSLLVLHEPFATSLDRGDVGRRLVERASESVVIGVTASLRDARALGGHVLSLTGDGLPPPSRAGAEQDGLELIVATPDPGRLADAIEVGRAGEGLRRGVTCERRPGELVLRGADLEELSLRVLAASRDGAIPVLAISHRRTGALGRRLIDEALGAQPRWPWPFSRGRAPGRSA